ncbi:MAG: hypothetical protein RI973_589 [Bacteroidota bacterium]
MMIKYPMQPGAALQAMSSLTLFLLLSTLLLPQRLTGQAEPSALVELQSTDKGFLLPRMTQAQRDAIASPATGLMIFNSTSVCLDINFGSPAMPFWKSMDCLFTISSLNCAGAIVTGTLKPGQPAAGVSASISYTGGNGGAHSGQVVSSTGVTGLTATLPAGNFSTSHAVYAITGTPSGAGMANFALNIGGQTCQLSVDICGAYVAPNVWKAFMCRNLGATNTSADFFTPSWEINGGYWQWGFAAMAAPGPSGPDAGQANSSLISGWNTDAPNGAWSDDTKTANDPCPRGFRVPTLAQWDGVRNNNTQSITGTWTSSSINYSSGRFFGPGLMLPAAGNRWYFDGLLVNRGDYGGYWSSTESGTEFAWRLYFSSGSADTFYNYRRNGFSLRCIAE